MKIQTENIENPTTLGAGDELSQSGGRTFDQKEGNGILDFHYFKNQTVYSSLLLAGMCNQLTVIQKRGCVLPSGPVTPVSAVRAV